MKLILQPFFCAGTSSASASSSASGATPAAAGAASGTGPAGGVSGVQLVKEIDPDEWRFLLTGATFVDESAMSNPTVPGAAPVAGSSSVSSSSSSSESSSAASPSSAQTGWLDNNQWNNVVVLSKMKAFENLHRDVALHVDEWKEWCWRSDPSQPLCLANGDLLS